MKSKKILKNYLVLLNKLCCSMGEFSLCNFQLTLLEAQ